MRSDAQLSVPRRFVPVPSAAAFPASKEMGTIPESIPLVRLEMLELESFTPSITTW